MSRRNATQKARLGAQCSTDLSMEYVLFPRHISPDSEPRFNEVAGDLVNLFVKSRFRYIENLDITNLRENDQNIRYIEV